MAALLFSVLPAAPTAHAATTWTVTRSDDRNTTCTSGTDCSLREALAAAANGDTIAFKSGLSNVNLTVGELVIDKSLTIQGPGANVLTVRRTGSSDFRIFHVTTGTSTISGLTISNGNVDGGGILLDGVASLNVVACTISDNVGNLGGGIFSTGALTITASTLSNNTANNQGGALHLFAGTATVTNSTVSGNRGPWGGLLNVAQSGGTSTLSVVSSTFVDNTQNVGTYGLNGASAITTVASSLFVKRSGSSNLPHATDGSPGATWTLTSLGHNLVDDDSSEFTNGVNGDIVGPGVTALLDPTLANNGGPTRTHKLLAGSPAIDAGASVTSTDQRGQPRAGAGAGPDIGAFEVQPPVIDLNGGAAGVDYGGSFTEGGLSAPAVDSANLTVADLDSTNLASATVTILDQFDGAAETLSASVAGTTISAPSYNAATGVLTLTGSDTLAHYQQALRTVTYNNTSANPDPRSRHLRFVVNDGVVNGPPATTTLTIGAADTGPTITAPASVSTNEDTALVLNGANLISISDPDVGGADVQVALAVSHGSLALSGTSGLTINPGANASPAMTLTGTLAAINTALNGLRYTPTANYAGPDALTINTSDLGHTGSGGPKTSSGSVAITVTAAGDAPTIGNPGPQTTNEGTATAPICFTVGDVDTPVASLVVTGTSSNLALVPNAAIAAAPAGACAGRGVIVTPAGDQNGTVDITLTVSDGSLQASTAFTLTVSAVNDAPVNTVPGGQSTAEDTPLVFSTGHGNAISVADVDAPTLQVALTATGGTVTLNGTIGLTTDAGANGSSTVTVSGTQSALNAALNGLTFTPALHSTAASTVKIVTSDLGNTGSGGALTATDTVAITIGAVNNPPTISPIAPQSTAEDTATSAISFTVGDVETAPAALTVTAVSSNPAVVPAAGITLEVLSSDPTGASRTVRILPAAEQSGPADVTLTVSDGSLQASTTFTLVVDAIDDAPVNSLPAAQNVNQNASLVFSSGNGNLLSVSDVDAGTSPIKVALTATNGTITLNGTGGLTVTGGANGTPTITVTGPLGAVNNALNGLRFTPTAGYIGAASLQIATDDQGATGAAGPKTDTDTIAIAVQPFHASPTISPIADQGVDSSGSTPAVPFTVGSTEVPVTSLVVTATSSNQDLVPSSAITLSGTAAARTIRVTPTPSVAGVSTIDVQVSDGTASAHATFQVTVLESSLVVTAVSDSYSLGMLQSLTVPANTGVLANDAGILSGPGSQPSMAALVSGPANGTLKLSSDGSFTYTPNKGFVGTDSFTYVVNNGPRQSLPGRVTITVLPVACAPRATVKVSSTAVNGKLQVTVVAQPLDQQTNNYLTELRFGTFQNGKVTFNNQPVESGATVTVPGTVATTTFTVERATPGQPTTIPFTTVDQCGAWPSFVGGGPGAGF